MLRARAIGLSRPKGGALHPEPHVNVSYQICRDGDHLPPDGSRTHHRLLRLTSSGTLGDKYTYIKMPF